MRSWEKINWNYIIKKHESYYNYDNKWHIIYISLISYQGISAYVIY